MTPYYQHGAVTIYAGDVREVLPLLSGKFHAVLCDPPYGLEFMGKEWDAPHKASSFPKPGNIGGFADGNKPSFARQGNFGQKYQEWVTSWGEALLPLLYPGGLVLCFGGTRTWHRLAAGLEDAGFQMWDTLMWLHGQGFPKAQDISKLIDKANGDERKVVSAGKPIKRMIPGADQNKTGSWIKDNGREFIPTVEAAGSGQSAPWAGHKTCALKPAWEPVLCFRAPIGGKSYAELAQMFGSGALYVDGGRIGTQEEITPFGSPRKSVGGIMNRTEKPREVFTQSPLGRYPANLALECTCELTEIVDAPVCGDISNAGPRENAVYGKDAKPRGDWKAYRGKMRRHTDPDCPCFILDQQSGELSSGDKSKVQNGWGANGIYGTGQPHLKISVADSGGASRFFYTSKADRTERHSFNEVNPTTRNSHPTVKPIDLCRWLATLLLPPESVKPRRLLVPFSGSGSEMIGALLAGWDEVVGIDQDPEYCKLVPARIEHHVGLFAKSDFSEVAR